MPAIFEHPLVVAPEEIDRLGHVNNLVYLAWMQQAALAHSAAQGWPTERYEELGSGLVVRSHTIKYLQPAYQGEPVVVRTWVADMTKVSSTRRYKIVRRQRPVPAGLGRHAMGLRRLCQRHVAANPGGGDPVVRAGGGVIS